MNGTQEVIEYLAVRIAALEQSRKRLSLIDYEAQRIDKEIHKLNQQLKQLQAGKPRRNRKSRKRG